MIAEHDVHDDSDGQEVVAVEKKIEHPNYIHAITDADFALLVLSELVTWRQEVQPVCLPGLAAGSYENIEVLTDCFELVSLSKHERILMQDGLYLSNKGLSKKTPFSKFDVQFSREPLVPGGCPSQDLVYS